MKDAAGIAVSVVLHVDTSACTRFYIIIVRDYTCSPVMDIDSILRQSDDEYLFILSFLRGEDNVGRVTGLVAVLFGQATVTVTLQKRLNGTRCRLEGRLV